MGLYRWIKEMPNWKALTGIVLAQAGLMVAMSAPHVHVGRESAGMNIRRYTTWMFTTPEPVVAEVRKGEYDGKPLIGKYSFDPAINETVTSSRVYRGENGEIIGVHTDDWGRDGVQDALRVIVTTGELGRGNRKELYVRYWTKERLSTDWAKERFGGKQLVLFSDRCYGSLTEKEAVSLSPDLQRFADAEGNIDAERLAIGVRDEAYKLTKAGEDGRFMVR